MTHCHCSRCRKHHGTAFGTMVGTPAQGFRWEQGAEHVRGFRSTAGLGRFHCQLCGSKVPEPAPTGDVAWIPAGTLDDDCGVRPIAHIFASSHAPWFAITGALPRFEDAPPGYPITMPSPIPLPAATGTVPGSCLCGAVSYALEGELGPFYFCHCSRCRKARGAACAANLFVRAEQLKWLTGERRVRVFDLPGAERFGSNFCAECGSAVPRFIAAKAAYGVPAGGLDHDPGIRPEQHIFVASKAVWYEITDDLPQFPERSS
jgi:hypothetical protein